MHNLQLTIIMAESIYTEASSLITFQISVVVRIFYIPPYTA